MDNTKGDCINGVFCSHCGKFNRFDKWTERKGGGYITCKECRKLIEL